MVVRTPSLVYIYLPIVSRHYMNVNKVFLLSLSLSLNRMIKPLQATLFSLPADPFGKLDMIGHHEKKLGTVTY